MVEQVIFKIDKSLKEQAMRKARREGITYSAVLKEATQAYVENHFEIGLVYRPQFIRHIRKVLKEPSLKGSIDNLVKKM